MQAAMDEFATLQTSVGPVALGMKIGIGVGDVLAMQVGGVSGRWEYVIAGDPLRQVAEAEKSAKRGETILSPEAKEILHPDPLPPHPLARPDWSAVDNPEAALASLRRFIPRAARVWLDRGLSEFAAVLRPMTVLFMGLSGLDYAQPEAVGQLHGFLRAVQETLERYEGSINKVAVDDKGTILLALFGAPPVAHEDDAVRAVRCALDLRAEARREGLHLAVGVTTGHVFAGPVGSETQREYTAMGDVVNMAARLMGQSGAWGILCDFDTHRQARDQMVFESLAPIQVKGKAEPVRIYHPTGEIVSQEPAVLSSRGALVGREAEAARLRAALDGVEAGQGCVLIVEGSAGIGKSRLVVELAQMAQDRELARLTGAGHSIEHYTPYRAWRDVFTAYFDLKELTDAAARQARVRRAVNELAPDQAGHLPLLNDVLNLDLPETESTAALEPAQRQEALFGLLLALLQARAGEGPLLIVLDNAQWLDSLSWKLAVHVAQGMVAAGEPLLLALAARPLGEESTAAQSAAELRALTETETLSLRPLDDEEIVAIAAACLGLPPGGLPDPVAELVRQRAGGNPFFGEQLMFTLQEQGFIQVRVPEDRPAECTVIGDLVQARQALPDTIQGLILARIDRLTPERQLTLKVGSVIGYIFPYLTLSDTVRLHAAISDDDLQAHLDALDIRRLTAHYASRPDLAYIFRQLITQDVAYRSLPFAQRRRLHQEVALWYEEFHAVDLSPYYALLAYHWSTAQVADKAIHYLLLAGDGARALYALQEAIDYYQRALEFLREQEDDDLTARTLMKLGLTYHLAFDFQNARRTYEEGFAFWQKAGEAPTDVSLLPASRPFRMDWPYLPLTLDPALAQDVDTYGVIDQLFSGLVDLGPGMDVVPNVAHSWEVSEDGLRYVFHLRDDVRWSDGTPVTAADFEYAWKRALNPATGSMNAFLLYDIKGAQAYHKGETSDPDTIEVETLDDFTLAVELEQPTSYLFYLLAFNVSYPVPRHMVTAHSEAWTETHHLVTNGPFRLESWRQNNDQDGSLILTRNPDYHERSVGNVQRIELRAYPSGPARIEAYETAELDTLNFRDLAEARERVRQRHAGEYLSAPRLATTYIGFDVNRPPFDDLRVRRAFVLAVDREQYADVHLRGFSFPATGGFVPPGMPGHSADLSLPYDPDQARELLAQAGYAAGHEFPDVEFLGGPGYDPEMDYLAARWYENLGLRITWQAMEWGTFFNRLETAIPHIFLNIWANDYPDPDNFLRDNDAVRLVRWHDETYLRLVEMARQVPDQQERMEIYHQADEILIEAAVLMPFTYLRSHFLLKPWVTKFPTSAAEWWYLKDVVIESAS